MSDWYVSQTDKFVGVDEPPTLAISAFNAAEFAATRVQWEQTDAGHSVQCDRADGCMLCLQRWAVPLQPYWVEQVALSLRPIHASATKTRQASAVAACSCGLEFSQLE